PLLMEWVSAARVEPVAAKGSGEARVALEQRDFPPAAGEQVGEARSRGAGTDDDDASDRHDAFPSCLETSTVARDWHARYDWASSTAFSRRRSFVIARRITYSTGANTSHRARSTKSTEH